VGGSDGARLSQPQRSGTQKGVENDLCYVFRGAAFYAANVLAQRTWELDDSLKQQG